MEWWDEKIHEYNLKDLKQAVLDKKDQRNKERPLNGEDAYDFMVFISNHQT
jgi:hypothetical protein